MSLWLKQSTVSSISFGPFVSASDGVTVSSTLVAGLDSTSGLLLAKNGGALSTRSATQASSYDKGGNYVVVVNATDTATLGSLRLQAQPSTAILPVWKDVLVLPANVYDSLLSTGDVLDVSVTQWLGTAAATPTVAGVPEVDATHWNGTAVAAPATVGYPVVTVKVGTGTGEISVASGIVDADVQEIDGDSAAATQLQRAVSAIAIGTCDTGSTATSIVTSSLSPAATTGDQFKGRILTFDDATTTAALRGQATDITASTAGGVLTCTALTVGPASGDTFTIT